MTWFEVLPEDESRENVIYRITSKTTGLSYIGQTKRTLKNRLKAHVKAARSNTTNELLIVEAIREYGVSDFLVDVLYSGYDDLNALERDYISIHSTLHPNGYNRSPGGGTPSEDARELSRELNSKPFSVVDPSGKLHIGKNLLAFCREHDLFQSGVWQVLQGYDFHCKGWRRPDQEGIPFDSDFIGRPYKGIRRLCSPNGTIYETKDLKLFASQRGLNHGNLCNLANGKIRQHKGWTLAA